MNTDTLDFPVITDTPAAAVAEQAGDKPTLNSLVLASFSAIEGHMVTLAARYSNVAFDVSTTKGLDAAKAARLDLREQGRYAVQRLDKRLKAEVTGLKKLIDTEGERLIQITKPVEDAIHAQITAEEERRAAEKAEQERIAAEAAAAEQARKDKHQAGITVIRGYLEQAKVRKLTAARIGSGIANLDAMTFGPEWEEFAAQAQAARDETMAALRTLQAETQAAEDEAARIEAQRVENERVAAELAAQRAELERQAAELARQRREADELAARQAAQATATYPSGAPMYGKTVKENGDRVMLNEHGNRSIFCDVDEGPDETAVVEAYGDALVTGTGVLSVSVAPSGEPTFKRVDPQALNLPPAPPPLCDAAPFHDDTPPFDNEPPAAPASDLRSLNDLNDWLGVYTTETDLAKHGFVATHLEDGMPHYERAQFPAIAIVLADHLEHLALSDAG